MNLENKICAVKTLKNMIQKYKMNLENKICAVKTVKNMIKKYERWIWKILSEPKPQKKA